MEASVRLLGSGLRRIAARPYSSPSSSTSTSTSTASLRVFTTTTHLSAQEDFPSTPPSSRSTIPYNISNLLDESLDLNKGQHATRQSRFPSRHPAPTNTGSSIADFARNMTTPARSRKNNDNPSSSSTSSSSSSSSFNIDSFFSTPPPSGISPESELPHVKLDPTLGRTIKVDKNRGVDVGKAFRTLEIQCARNSVRKDFMRQRFHERPGLKRKRLKGERWRRNFKAGFKETVKMVVRMKRQGW